MFKSILTAAMAFLFTATASAAEVWIEQFDPQDDGTPGDYYITLSGDIVPGDLDRLRAAYLDPRIKYNPVLFLNSNGGDGYEMRAIIDYMDVISFRAAVHTYDVCYSACAAIWAHASDRFMFQGAVIGFHISSYPPSEGLSEYVDNYGIQGFQQLVNMTAAEDLLYYSHFPVLNQLEFVRNIATYGNYDEVFWVISTDEAETIIGAIVL